MREAQGDLWKLPAHARCVTTNGITRGDGAAVMGRGCAREARDMFPGLAESFGALLRERGNHVALLAEVGSWHLLSFPVKHRWHEPADLSLIQRSCGELAVLADEHPEWETILLPRPGCGNGSLRWSNVRAVIAPLLDDRVVVIDR